MTAGRDRTVTLVIPGRNCERTLARCLESVVPLLHRRELKEIIFVDDGSTDRTAEIASGYPVRVLESGGRGPGAARNVGWRAAATELIWFIDSDCVAEPDALRKLLLHFQDKQVAGAGGSYGNLHPDSLLASLIHEEIVARHRRMPREVDFLGSFNVMYRRDWLELVSGFDERFKLAQDAELSYRIREQRGVLRFDAHSVVLHHHPRRLVGYLKTQCRHGFYRVLLYHRHPGRVRGDSYIGPLDAVLPVLVALGGCGFVISWMRGHAWWWTVPLGLAPVAVAFVSARRLQRPPSQTCLFVCLSLVRAVARGVGVIAGFWTAARRTPIGEPTGNKREEGIPCAGGLEPDCGTRG
jgi:cellulose synthase/poly-beta-1,6-N-acetylglucosamine synthase-like glycosyltransferase